MTALYLATALLRGLLWPVILPPAILVILREGVVLREECALEATFSERRRAYWARVRRWL